MESSKRKRSPKSESWSSTSEASGASSMYNGSLLPVYQPPLAYPMATFTPLTDSNGFPLDPHLAAQQRTSKNAEACARYRERRKRQVTDLAERNRQLEQERTLFLSRIAELQSQVQFLRGGGDFDLTKENELLRAEVENHKRLVKDLMKASQRADDISLQEKTRMLYGVVESAVSQALGLAVTSANDARGWISGKDVTVNKNPMKMFYQYLPLGVAKQDAHRLNLRFVARNELEVSIDEIKAAILRSWSDTELLKGLFDNFAKQVTCKRTVERLFTGIKEDHGNRGVTLVKVTGKDEGENADKDCEPEYELVYATGYKFVEIHPATLLGTEEAKSLGIPQCNKPVPGLVMVQTTSSHLNRFLTNEFEKGTEDRGAGIVDSPKLNGAAKLSRLASTASSESSSSNSDEFRSPLLLGHIAWPHETKPNCIRTLVVKSFPIGDETFRNLTGRACPAVSEDGTLDPHFAKEMEERYVRGFQK